MQKSPVLAATLEPPPARLGVTRWSTRLLAAELHAVAAPRPGHCGVPDPRPWAALDPATGHNIWQVADPNGRVSVKAVRRPARLVEDGWPLVAGLAEQPAAP